MKVAILMAGPYRGNVDIIQNQLNMIGSYDTYVSCIEHYKKEWIDSNWPIKQIFSTPNVDFKETNLKASPKPEHLIIFKDNKGRRIGARAVWYKNKIDISSFEVLN